MQKNQWKSKKEEEEVRGRKDKQKRAKLKVNEKKRRASNREIFINECRVIFFIKYYETHTYTHTHK